MGLRCYGFQSLDGQIAYCTRENYAGYLTAPVGDGSMWMHHLGRSCKCGLVHGIPAPEIEPPSPAEQRKADAKVWDIWRATAAFPGDPHIRYLHKRSLDPGSLPSTLRFTDALERWDRGNLQMFPAMIAGVFDLSESVSGRQIGIHRTYLQSSGEKATGISRKSLGPISGGCIPLGRPNNGTVAVSEGIETALSVQQNTGLICWAAISASGMQALRLPDRIKSVIIFAEPDQAGQKSADKAAERWAQEGRTVHVALSRDGDANDVLMRHGPRGVRALLARAQVYSD